MYEGIGQRMQNVECKFLIKIPLFYISRIDKNVEYIIVLKLVETPEIKINYITLYMNIFNFYLTNNIFFESFTFKLL